MRRHWILSTFGGVLLAGIAAWATTDDYQQTITNIQQSALSANWISVILQFAGVATVFYLAFQMGSARQELNEVRKDMADVSGRVANLDGRVQGLGDRVANLSGQVARLPGSRRHDAQWSEEPS